MHAFQELHMLELSRGVRLWQPSVDVLHSPNIEPQSPGCDQVLLGLPLGECGGVRMANQIIGALSLRGNVYGNHEPTHGADATQQFIRQGARFDMSPEEIAAKSPHATYVISAHGAAPSVIARAEAAGLDMHNVTCPLVDRTHNVIRKAADDPRNVVAYLSFGKRDHPEIVASAGLAEELEVPFHVISNTEDIDAMLAKMGERDSIVIAGQTTNNSDDAQKLASEIDTRATPKGLLVARTNAKDVCHTVRDRQTTTREIIAQGVGTLVVVGSVNSKNTMSLAKVAAQEAAEQKHAVELYLVNSWLQLPGIKGRVGVVSGASTLDQNVHGVVTRLNAIMGVKEVGLDTDKDIVFKPIDQKTRKVMDEQA
jgi:4-hydroxy-3-methylbut-2-en-1-yl diphosphate reductase